MYELKKRLNKLHDDLTHFGGLLLLLQLKLLDDESLYDNIKNFLMI